MMEECKLLQLPAELLAWIGSYLPSQSLASLCLQSKYLRSTFADQLPHDTIAPLVLLWAAEVGDTTTMRQALAYRPDVNYKNWEGRTPLSFMAERGDIAMTRLLLDVNDVDIYGNDIVLGSPLSWASKMGHAEVVDLLVAADVDDMVGYIDCALTVATWHGQAGIVKKLLTTAEKDPSILGYGGCGEASLCSAALDGEEDIVKLYLVAGVNHNAREGHGRSALHLASGYHDGVMKLLIAAGADVNMRDHDGRTPLMQAVENGHKIGVEILLDAEGIDIDDKDWEGETALSLAELNEHEEIVKLLCAAK